MASTIARLIMLGMLWVHSERVYSQDAAGGGPSRESIEAYARQCIAEQRQMDLVARFGTSFRYLDLRGVDFRGVDRIDKPTILSGADFTGADLRDAQFGPAAAVGASFKAAKLDGADFDKANLTRADFTGAQLGSVRFQECYFIDARMSFVDVSRAQLHGCRFPGADLTRVKLRLAANDLGWFDFTRATLCGADLSGLSLVETRLAEADLTAADLRGADLTEADLTRADLPEAKFEGAVFTHAILDGVTGLAPDVMERLRAEADRAGFEAKRAKLHTARRGRRVLKRWGYGVTVGLVLVTVVGAWRSSDQRRWPMILAALNALAFGAAVLLLLILDRGVTRDLNASLRSALTMLGGLILVPGALGIAAWTVVSARKRGERRGIWWLPAAIALTGVHVTLVMWLVLASALTG